MALPAVKFNVPQGGLGRVADGEDHVSALLFDGVAAPGAFGTGVKLKSFVDIEQVKAAGITEGDANYGFAYYQASEFFRLAPGATLWLCFSITFPTDLEGQGLTGGKVKQIGVFFDDFADISATYQAGATALDAAHAPVVIIAGHYSDNVLDLATVADQALNSAPNVSVLLAGDGNGLGKALATALGKVMVPAVGAVLGATSKASVHESIAWVEQYNLSDGSELETIRLADGTESPTEAALEPLNTKRYLVLRKHTGIGGTYLNDNHTCIAATNDFAYQNLNRVMNKAKRLIRAKLLPQLNSPLTVDGDTGKLAASSAKSFENQVAQALNPMSAAQEVSDFGVYVNPDQNVLQTSTLTIQVKIVPRGIARNIVVNIGFSVTTGF